MIITIDGPAGSGKSSVARELARRLGLPFLDTGMMYRAVAYAVRAADIDPDNETVVGQLLMRVKLEFGFGYARLDGCELDETALRTAEIAGLSSRVAALPVVRCFLVARQQDIGRDHALVTEGRDQGTVVFPDAECKFFLVAERTERATRRMKDLMARGHQVAMDEVLKAQDERDRRDAERHDGPMIAAADAAIIDSSGRTLDDVITDMEARVRRCLT